MGNLLADFVRGKPDGRFSPETTKAIYLHRYVDGYIDNQPEIKTCRSLFPAPLYRFSAIALDIFWDHALIHHWPTFSPEPFAAFVASAEAECAASALSEPTALPEAYLRLSGRMWREDWLGSYGDIQTLPWVLKRMSSRSPRMTPLAHTADTLLTHRETLLDAFPVIYQNVLSAAAQFHQTQQG